MMLLLASRSPRRAQLLRDAGYVFEQLDPPFEDPAAPSIVNGVHASPQQLAMDLAARKALSSPVSSSVILAADTLCVEGNGDLLGTPTSLDEARTMIRSFVNQAHDVVTGVALRPVNGEPIVCFADTARVHFGLVNIDQIEAYLTTGMWEGKAGGYNLFDRKAEGWPIHVQGDPTTVVGLPMKKLHAALKNLGISPAPGISPEINPV